MGERLPPTTWFVVRTDVGGRPHWLTNLPKLGAYDYWRHVPTDKCELASWFSDPEDAKEVAEQWSDVPGVWRVVAVAPSREVP